MKRRVAVAGVAVAMALLPLAGQAVLITNPEVVYQPGASTVYDASQLSGTLNVSYSGGILTVVVNNTTPDTAGDGVGVLLCGWALDFENPIAGLVGLSDDIPAGTAQNFGSALTTSLEKEWGYSAPSIDGLSTPNATHSYQLSAGTVSSMITTFFPGNDLGGSPNADGPDFGIQSALEDDDPSQAFVSGGTATFTFRLAADPGNATAGLIAFASPTARRVPDGGSTIFALGLALMGLEIVRRKIS